MSNNTNELKNRRPRPYRGRALNPFGSIKWKGQPLAAAKRPILAGLNRGINDGSSFCGAQGCLRCLLLVICTHPFVKAALTLHLARSEGRERYFGCNLMQRKVLRHLTNT